jgi:hypothetical protein
VCRPWSAPLSDATGTIHNTCGGIVIVRKIVILCSDVYRHCYNIQIKKQVLKAIAVGVVPFRVLKDHIVSLYVRTHLSRNVLLCSELFERQTLQI